MTTSVTDEKVHADTQLGSRTWGEIVFRLAGQIARMPEYDRGGFAGLRRMDPDGPDTAAFWRLMAREDLLGNPAIERKWGLILHGIALMTRTNGDDVTARSAHDGRMPVGRALYLGGEAQRDTAFYSEVRFSRLLMARDGMLRVLLARMFRMLAAKRVAFNWREMAAFILNDGFNEERAEYGRRRLARDYYRAERRSSQRTDKETQADHPQISANSHAPLLPRRSAEPR